MVGRGTSYIYIDIYMAPLLCCTTGFSSSDRGSRFYRVRRRYSVTPTGGARLVPSMLFGSFDGTRRYEKMRHHHHQQQQSVALSIVSAASSLTAITLLLTSSVAAKPATVLVTSRRWAFPCAGSVLVEGSGDDVVMVTADEPDALLERMKESKTNNVVDSIDWPDTLRTLSDKAKKLKKRVRDLKKLYVRYRFRDESLAEDLENLGVRMDGMPKVDDVTVGGVNNENLIETLHTAFEYLARVAVFLEQARIGENLASNENVSFENHYRRLEDDHESGLYWLLCALHRMIYFTGSRIDADVIGDIMRTKLVEVDRNALRDARDYLVLRDFEKVLERISFDLGAMSYLYPPT